MIVVDANVAVKWHVPEKGEDVADAFLRNKDVLIAPGCIRNEVLSAIVRSVSEKRSTPQKAEQQCRLWLEQLSDRAIMTFEEGDLLLGAMTLGIKHSHYFIDCLYLALCLKPQATLVTFDASLSKVANRVEIDCKPLKEKSEPPKL